MVIALAAAACGEGGDGDAEVETGPDAISLAYAIEDSVTGADRDRIVAIIEDRLEDLGADDAAVEVDGDRLDIEVGAPGRNTVDDLVEIVGTQAELRFRPVLVALPLGTGETDGLAPTPSEDDGAEEEVVLDDPGGTRYRLGPAQATGTIVEDADAQLGSSGSWMVALTMTRDGIVDFNGIAAACAPPTPQCPTGQLAIVLDSEVHSAPSVQEPSFDRDDIAISGDFTEDEAKALALVLRYGALPSRLTLIEASGL